MVTRRRVLRTIGPLVLTTASAGQTAAAQENQQQEEEDHPDPRRESGDDEIWSLTVTLVRAETGDPVCAYINPYSWGTDEYLGEQGPTSSATWNGLSDGEYEIWVYDETSDWSYRESVWIDGSDIQECLEVTVESHPASLARSSTASSSRPP